MHGRVQLLLAGSLEPLTQDRDDLALRAAVHEHDEAKAEPFLVLGVQSFELRERFRFVVLPCSAAERADSFFAPIAGCAFRASSFSASLRLGDHLVRRRERVVTLGELLDESRAPFEQLRELVGRQLPR